MKRFYKNSLAAMLVIGLLLALFTPAQAAYSVLQRVSRFSATAGETLTTGQVVAIKDADGYAYKADTDDTTLRPAVGIIGKGGASGETVEIITAGLLSGWSSLTEGGLAYISATAGAVTQTQVAAYPQAIGVAISSTTYKFNFAGGIDVPNITREVYLPLAAAFLDGTGVIGNDGTTAPGLAETDNIPAIVYASSGESTKLQWTFRLPNDYVSGLTLKVLASSSVADGTEQAVDWQIWVNGDDVTFDAGAIAQTGAAFSNATLDASDEEVSMALDDTGEAALTAGATVTIDLWNAGTSDGTLEIKGVQLLYQASQ